MGAGCSERHRSPIIEGEAFDETWENTVTTTLDTSTTSESSSAPIDPRLKRIGIGVAIVFGALFVAELLFLRGEGIFYESGLRFSDSESREFKVDMDRPDEKHSVEVDTGKYEIALSYTVLDPEGKEIYSDTELFRHDRSRGFSFYPEAAGEHIIVVARERESGGLLTIGDRDSFSIRVLVGDRRIIGPMFDWMNF